MDFTILLQRLTNGDVYQANADDGSTYQVNHPPTSVMLAAARAIKQLVELNNNNQTVVQNQHKQIQDLLNDNELLRQNKSTSETSIETKSEQGN
jgi:hypothetical protein